MKTCPHYIEYEPEPCAGTLTVHCDKDFGHVTNVHEGEAEALGMTARLKDAYGYLKVTSGPWVRVRWETA